jgi:hypothetical protein
LPPHNFVSALSPLILSHRQRFQRLNVFNSI